MTFQLGFYFICQVVFIDRLSKVTAGNFNTIFCSVGASAGTFNRTEGTIPFYI